MRILLNRTILALALAGALVALAPFVITTFADTPPGVTFPIEELGGCESETECKTYCDDSSNLEKCVDFAEDHNLVSANEAERARKLSNFNDGPGGCSGHGECKNFCEDIGNIETCIDFAEKHHVLTDKELDGAKRIAAAIRSGVSMPGECSSENECKNYCSDSSHLEECITFGIAAGFMDPGEADEIRRAGHIIMDDGPGGCDSKNECENYCTNEANIEECVAFGLKHNFMSPEEAAMMRKTGGKGPGNCIGEECKDYCDDQAHSDECFEFGIKHNLIPEKDLVRMKAEVSKLRETLNNAPEEVVSCIKDKVGADKLNSILSGDAYPHTFVWEAVPVCFGHSGSGGPVDGPGDGFRGDPNVEKCVEDALGSELFRKFKNGEKSPEIMEKAKHCFDRSDHQDGDFDRKGEGGENSFFLSLPRDIRNCIKSTVRGDVFGQIEAGHIAIGGDTMPEIKHCFEQTGKDPGQFQGDSPDVNRCLEGVLNSAELDQMKAGGFTDNPANYERVRHCFGDFAPIPGPPEEYQKAYDEFKEDTGEFRHEFEQKYKEFKSEESHDSYNDSTLPAPTPFPEPYPGGTYDSQGNITGDGSYQGSYPDEKYQDNSQYQEPQYQDNNQYQGSSFEETQYYEEPHQNFNEPAPEASLGNRFMGLIMNIFLLGR